MTLERAGARLTPWPPSGKALHDLLRRPYHGFVLVPDSTKRDPETDSPRHDIRFPAPAISSKRISAPLSVALQTEPRSTAAVVTDSLRHTILRGAFAGGERLRQDAVAAQFKVSQTIVREAFKQLVAEGLLLSEPRRGVSVPALNADEAFEMTRLRSILEAQALEWAVPNMRVGDFDATRRVLVELDSATSVDSLITLNSEFHSLLYAPSNRQRTLALIETLRTSFERYLRYTWSETSHVETSQNEHWEILDLCRRGSGEKACELLRKHIMGTGTLLVDRLKGLA